MYKFSLLSLPWLVSKTQGAVSFRVPAGYYPANGTSKNFNTIEEYQSVDRGQVLQQIGKTVRMSMCLYERTRWY